MKFLVSLRAAKRNGRFINLKDPLPGSVPRVQFIYIRPEYEKLWETWAPQVPQPDGERPPVRFLLSNDPLFAVPRGHVFEPTVLQALELGGTFRVRRLLPKGKATPVSSFDFRKVHRELLTTVHPPELASPGIPAHRVPGDHGLRAP